jgi:hypothetical protein
MYKGPTCLEILHQLFYRGFTSSAVYSVRSEPSVKQTIPHRLLSDPTPSSGYLTMGDIPGQWALLALASAATQASTNQTNDMNNNTGKDSGIDWLTLFKSILPMLTLLLGLVGQYLVRNSPSSRFGIL